LIVLLEEPEPIFDFGFRTTHQIHVVSESASSRAEYLDKMLYTGLEIIIFCLIWRRKKSERAKAGRSKHRLSEA
jgi:hypothetical protein